MKQLCGAVLLVLLTITAFPQGHKPPSPGQSVVYFTRWSNFQPRIKFDYFDGEKVIGSFGGLQYLRYECKPGKHLFWASSANKDFVEAELKADSTYVIMVEPVAGPGIPQLKLVPAHPKYKMLYKARWFIVHAPSAFPDSAAIENETKRMSNFISKSLKEYAEQKPITPTVLKSEMAIPAHRLR